MFHFSQTAKNRRIYAPKPWAASPGRAEEGRGGLASPGACASARAMGTTEADARDGFGDSADNAPGPSPELVRRNASFALEELTSRYRVVEDLHRVYRSVPFAKIGSKLCAFDPNRDRYMNVLPYEHSAVKLSGGRRGDYINACAVQSGPRDLATFSYVATQGPLEGTIDDFWRMVLEQDVAAVVMLCDLVEDMMPKCAKYFPLEVGEAFETESFEVAATSKDVPFPGVERRALRVSEKRGTATAAVDHLRYSDWPDHGVPDHCESMVRVSRLIRGRYPRSRVAVHCSAGIGRTGTFCMIDVALRRVLGSGEELRGAEHAEAVDLESILTELRSSRAGMVQTVDQLVFAYRAIAAELRAHCGP